MKQRKKILGTFLGVLFSLLLHSAQAEEQIYFYDVPSSHLNSEAISYLGKSHIIKGFDDGSFRPNEKISRAAFTKIVIGSQFSRKDIQNCIRGDLLESPFVYFSDVPQREWFAPYICVAKKNGIVNGFSDGTFGPEKNITFPAAAKIITKSLALQTILGGDWYEPYINALAEKKSIPPEIDGLQYELQRKDMAEIIWRLKKNITSKPSLSAQEIISRICTPFNRENIPSVNMKNVRNTWLSWYNDERRQAGLPAYTLDDHLSRTATLWSEYSAKRGSMSHKRPGQEAYYDYGMITEWFKNLGMEFSNINRITYTENIGYGFWKCSALDCTSVLINAIRDTFEFYLAEKNQSSRPHYNAIFNTYFTKIGVGIALNKEQKRYYITTHFATNFSHSPEELCR